MGTYFLGNNAIINAFVASGRNLGLVSFGHTVKDSTNTLAYMEGENETTN